MQGIHTQDSRMYDTTCAIVQMKCTHHQETSNHRPVENDT